MLNKKVKIAFMKSTVLLNTEIHAFPRIWSARFVRISLPNAPTVKGNIFSKANDVM